jgi:Regulator of chromosome condensation (RCC1) repeat
VRGLTGVRTVALSSESGAFYALHTDGTVSAWGRNEVGQLGDRTTTTRLIPVKVLQDATTPMDEVCRIAAGSNVLLMARETGCSPGQRSINYGPWIVGLFIGQNFGGDSAAGFSGNGAIAKLATGWPVGQTGSQTASVMTVPDAANAGGAIAIRTGRGDGYIWGANGGNRLGAGSSVSFVGGLTGLVPGGWSGLYPVEMGRDFAIATDETGALESVGRNAEGQLGDGTTNSRTTMAPVLGLPAFPVTAYSAGQVSAAAIVNGQLWAWGWNGSSAVTVPARLGTGAGFTQVSVGDVHSLAIGPNGEVYSWGDSSFGALGRSGSGTLPAVVMRP